MRCLINFSCTQRKKKTSHIISRPITLTCSAWPLDQSLSSTTDRTSEPTEYSRIEADNSRIIQKKCSPRPTATPGPEGEIGIRHSVCHQLPPWTREHSSRSNDS